MDNYLVEIEKVNLTYNKKKDNAFQALFDINLKIKEGEFVVIFGPSGCGKSSLLNIIAGLEKPDGGKVFIEKKNIIEMENKKKVFFHRKKIGMVFQSYNLIATLSVLDNVALPQIFINQNKRQRGKKALDILNKFGIKEQAHKIPTELSGGQQQRIGIARAIINDPLLVLADEPIGNLDSESANNVMEILGNLNRKEGKTIILVSHNPENVCWGSHVIHMKDGRIIKEEITKTSEDSGKVVIEKNEVGRERESKFENILDKFKGLSEEQISFLIEPLKAEIMTDFLLVPYSEKQVELMKTGIRKRFSNKINQRELLKFFDEPLDDGGAGLDRRISERFCNRIENLLNISFSLANLENINEKVIKVLNYLSQEVTFKIEEDNIQKIGELIKNRITDKITHDEFRMLLDDSKEKGGIGLDKRTANKILREMDLILVMRYQLGFSKKVSEKVEDFSDQSQEDNKSPFL